MTKINPRVDLAFKKIFGVEGNKDLLMSLINSIVGKEDQVSDVTLLNPYNAQDFSHEKLSILDIKARNTDGKRFNIEIQISNESDYDKRALFYWSKVYAEQLQSGDSYSALSKTIGIHILNFTSIPDAPKYHNVFRITERDSNIVYFKDLELHTIELNKFTPDAKKDLSETLAKVKNSLDMWTAFLTRHDLLKIDDLPPELNSKEIKKALNLLNVMNFTEQERNAYEDHLKWLRIEGNTLEKAQADGFKQGKEEGREEGEVIGLKKGREEGKEEGVEEGRIIIAKKMLAKNRPIDEIIDFTGLTVQQIKELETV